MDAGLRERLEEAERAFAAAEQEMADPAVAGDPSRYAEVAKRYADLRPVVTAFARLRSALEDAADAAEMAAGESDAEMVEYLERTAA